MLKTIAAAAALAFASAGAHAAGMMDCCKDGKCCCAEKDGETPKKDEPHNH